MIKYFSFTLEARKDVTHIFGIKSYYEEENYKIIPIVRIGEIRSSIMVRIVSLSMWKKKIFIAYSQYAEKETAFLRNKEMKNPENIRYSVDAFKFDLEGFLL